MKKKIISCILVASLLFSIGCYNSQTITKEQLNSTAKKELETEFDSIDITVLTKDSSEYKFLKGNYRIHGDRLVGFGVRRIAGNDSSFHGSISFADITSLETTEFSLADTILAIGLPTIIAGFIGFIATAIQHSFSRR
jgi:hypothetical protein